MNIIMNIPSISEKDYKYDIGLLVLGGIIGYISTFYGGAVILLVTGAAIALAIGIRSDNLKNAILLGVFFGIIVVTSSSELVQGYGGDWNDNIFTSVFVPYFKDAFVGSILAGTVAAFGHSLRFRRR